MNILTLRYCLSYLVRGDCGSDFECTNGNCISQTLVNNTVNDCEDNSDEGKVVV